MFFFEKKNQKTFGHCGAPVLTGAARIFGASGGQGRCPWTPQAQGA